MSEFVDDDLFIDHLDVTASETIDEFTEWAAQHDYSLGPAFGQPADQRPAEAEGEEGEINLPIICVAVYDREADTADTEAEAAPSGRLVVVYPYVGGRQRQDG